MTTIDITMRHGHVSPKLEAFVREKASKLERYLRDSSRLEFVLEKDHEEYRGEGIVHDNGGPVVAHDHREGLHACIDALVDKLKMQLGKQKDRRNDHRGPSLADAASRADSGPIADDPSYEQVVRQTIKGDDGE